jgi:MFS family permease
MPAADKERLRTAMRLRNIRLFTAFRILFGARFYYPIFTILFLDMGLTLEQFSILNGIWAASIVLCEVPSGALADVIGRKRLLVAAAVLMVIEMAVLTFVPLGVGSLVFTAVLINRLLSGLAEALASGADQALAFDTLAERELEDLWPRVLEKVMRMQAIAMIVAMLTGALVYDIGLVQGFFDLLGLEVTVTREALIRVPLALNLLTAIALLLLLPRLREPEPAPGDSVSLSPADGSLGRRLALAFIHTGRTGKWIVTMPFVTFVILAVMTFDSTVRQFVVLISEYFRVIDIPVAWFGILASSMVGLNIVAPSQGRFMVERFSLPRNLAVLAAIILIGLTGCAFALPYWGVLPAMVLLYGMTLTDFFASHYLNRAVPSSRRATVLSFRGLAANLAYGGVSFLYAILSGKLEDDVDQDALPADMKVESAVLAQSLPWFVGWFAITVLLLGAAGIFLLRRQPDASAARDQAHSTTNPTNPPPEAGA